MWVYRNWRRHAKQSSINQTGMDFVTESQLGKSFKVYLDKHLYGIERTLIIFDYY